MRASPRSVARASVTREPPTSTRPSLIDRAVGLIGLSRTSRVQAGALGEGGYVGASRVSRRLRNWQHARGTADEVANDSLEELRERSYELRRNTPLASGALSTNVTNVVGTGLRLHAAIDGPRLGLVPDTAAAWERRTEALFSRWANTTACDLARRSTFPELQAITFRAWLEGGDIFTMRRHRPGLVKSEPFNLRLQSIEAGRVSNPFGRSDSARLSAGCESDVDGAPVAYHIADRHDGGLSGLSSPTRWRRTVAFSEVSGERLVLHHAVLLRPDQTRGVPYLAGVIECFKQIGRYTDAELEAAVLGAFLTLAIEQEGVDEDALETSDPNHDRTDDDELELGPGAIISLAEGEKANLLNPGRPNAQFDAFVMAIMRQIGVALELPVEVLLKHFLSSYSASRGALLEAWKFWRVRRSRMVSSYCNPVYRWWMLEAVGRGMIVAPGFFDSSEVQAAWLGAEWYGDAQGQLDPLKETRAATEKIDAGISTIQRESAELNGSDATRNHTQRVVEQAARVEGGLVAAVSSSPGAAAAPAADLPPTDREDADQ